MNPSRRAFVKTVLVSSCFSGLALHCCLGQIAPTPTPSTGFVRLRLTDFTDLQNVNGSITIRVPGTAGSLEPLIVTRVAGNKVYAVSNLCTHQGCDVNAFDAGRGGLACPCHGSVFSASGGVIRGPAQRALRSFKATLETNFVAIEIPGIAYVITVSKIATSAGVPRIKLLVPTAAGQTYQVLFSNILPPAANWGPVNCALSAEGAADQSSFAGDGSKMTVYVDITDVTGFFSVAET